MTEPVPAGYFSAPRMILDPSLFDAGNHLRPEVRKFILSTARGALKDFGFDNVARWLHIWLAGSGVSYQWGNGDLDVLLGVDYSKFTRSNPDYSGVDESAVASAVNTWLKRNVWSLTSRTHLNGSEYEATFYWNPGIGTVIEQIMPYAAFDVQRQEWIVKPPQLPPNPSELFSPSWYTTADNDRTLATELSKRASSASRRLRNATHEGKRRNLESELAITHSSARALLEAIHMGRRIAFAELGHGYRDYHNFRWQRAKATGVIKDLRRIVDAADALQEHTDSELYGAPIEGAQETLRRAELWKSGRLR